jgi:hypothetical protein
MDGLEFIARCEDRKEHGIYDDPPFPGAGRRYKNNAGQTDEEERNWHTRLRDALERLEHARVVCRFYDHPLVRELYGRDERMIGKWQWKPLTGRKQTNENANELLIVRNAGKGNGRLF